MPLFLVTSLYDEGISPNLFRVVEADSAEAVAAHMLEHPEQWGYFLSRAFADNLPTAQTTLAQLLERISRTFVDGDSSAQLRITPITVQRLNEVTTTPAFQPGAMFSDFG